MGSSTPPVPRGRAEAAAGAGDGRTAFAGSQPVQQSARGKSSPASAPRGVCRSVQPRRSAIKCSKASRSSHRAVRQAPAAPQGRGGSAAAAFSPSCGRAPGAVQCRRRGRGRLGAGWPAGRRELGQGCQAPRSGAGISHANNLQPVTKHGGAQHRCARREQLGPQRARSQRCRSFRPSELGASAPPNPQGLRPLSPGSGSRRAGAPSSHTCPPRCCRSRRRRHPRPPPRPLHRDPCPARCRLPGACRRTRWRKKGSATSAGAPPPRRGRRGGPTPLSSGLRSLPRVSSASKRSPREGGAGAGSAPRGLLPPLSVPLRAREQHLAPG